MRLRNLAVLTAAFLCAIVFAAVASAETFQTYKDAMKLSDADAAQAQPIIEKYLAQQDQLFKDLQALPAPSPRPNAPGQDNNGAGGNNGNDGNRPPRNGPRRALMQKFMDNQQAAVSQLQTFLAKDQVDAFTKTAAAGRQATMRQLRGNRPHRGGNRPGNDNSNNSTGT